MLELDVVLLAGLLVLREGRSAAGTPLRRPVPLVQPAAPVHLLQETPDVLDVRVAEREVGVVPVHPHAEALRLLGDHPGEVRDPLLAALRELCEPVLLDVSFGIEAERLLHLDLDVEALAVEAVLVALRESAERLVALEDVLQGSAPGVVHAHRIVRGDRPVHEAERRAAAIALDELGERPLALPQLENLALERRMVRDRRKLREGLRHAFDSRRREQDDRPAR